jgi:hypothetical protein
MAEHQHGHGKMGPYAMLGIMLLIHGIIMYLVMYLMIDTWADFFPNINQLYMTLAMVAPMAIGMILFMGSMYPNKKLNYALFAGAAVVFAVGVFGTRDQTLVGNDQFLRSMIPHHSGAILMCREARITDPELKSLCVRIEQSQKEEIDQMKAILARPH